MASLTDILSAAKNIVTAINEVGQTITRVNGSQSAAAISLETLVSTGEGRLCRVIVTTPGSTAGDVYDASSVGAYSSPIYVIPMAVGVYEVNIPTTMGILVKPGTGQVASVTYS